jgi:hypothetical protein
MDLIFNDAQLYRIRALLQKRANGAAEVRINAPSTDGYGQAVSDLQQPERGHNRTIVGHSVKQATDRVRGLVATDPGKRRRTVENQTHERPSSR